MAQDKKPRKKYVLTLRCLDDEQHLTVYKYHTELGGVVLKKMDAVEKLADLMLTRLRGESEDSTGDWEAMGEMAELPRVQMPAQHFYGAGGAVIGDPLIEQQEGRGPVFGAAEGEGGVDENPPR